MMDEVGEEEFRIPVAEIESLQFGFVNPNDLAKTGVPIDKSGLFEHRQPTRGGPIDLQMGTVVRSQKCSKCSDKAEECIGHEGRIHFAKAVFNTEINPWAMKALRSVCCHCSAPLIRPEHPKYQWLMNIQDRGVKLDKVSKWAVKIKHCGCHGTDEDDQKFDYETYDGSGCGAKQPLWYIDGMYIKARDRDTKKEIVDPKTKKPMFDSNKIYQILKYIKPEDVSKIGFDTKHSHPSWMMFTDMAAPPPTNRCSFDKKSEDGSRGQDDLTKKLKRIIKANVALQKHLDEKDAPEKEAIEKKLMKKEKQASTADKKDQKDGKEKKQEPKKKRKRKDESDEEDEEDDDEEDTEDDEDSEDEHTDKKLITQLSVRERGFVVVGGTNKPVRKKKTVTEETLFDDLQFEVASFLNAKWLVTRLPHQRQSNKAKGMRQIMQSKKGRFRQNLGGKRVDFSGRTVIVVEPFLHNNALKVPKMQAMKLTRPVVPQAYNAHQLTSALRNGPHVHPGANYLIREDQEHPIDLGQPGVDRNVQILKRGKDKITRHLINQDPVLFNRQPSLQQESAMSHYAFVWNTLTAGMSGQVTTPYNADFDGDEMNLHVPQTEPGRAELKEEMMASTHINSWKDGRPTQVPVQDFPIAAMKLTEPGRVFKYEDALNMMYQSCYVDQSRFPKPTIFIRKQSGKLEKYLTGHDMFSALMPRKMQAYHQVSVPKARKDPSVTAPTTLLTHNEQLRYDQHDGLWIDRDGYVAFGLLDKPKLRNITHILAKDVNGDTTADWIHSCVLVLHQVSAKLGWTASIGDAINPVKEKTDRIIEKGRAYINALKFAPKPGHAKEKQICDILAGMKERISATLLEGIQDQIRRTRGKHHNNLFTIIMSGSKGSKPNLSQIMVALQQQETAGNRLLATLSHFRYSTDIDAFGFIDRGFLQGLTPAQFFFHTLCGRDGLIDTAVKTAETGYLQRRKADAMKAIRIALDGTVIDGSGTVIQSCYGEDHWNGSRVEATRLRTITLNHEQLRAGYYGGSEAEFETVKRERDTMRRHFSVVSRGEITDACTSAIGFDRIIKSHARGIGAATDISSADVVVQLVTSFLNSIRRRGSKAYTPLFVALVHDWFNSRQVMHEYGFRKADLSNAIAEMERQFYFGIVDVGVCVGTICAQSTGEPATQMTLNTFHNAGQTNSCVSMGVPRLKEIYDAVPMTSMKTPSMNVYFNEDVTEMQVDKIAAQIVELLFGDLVHDSEVIAVKDCKSKEEDTTTAQSTWMLCDNIHPPGNVGDYILHFALNKKACIKRHLTPRAISLLVREKLAAFEDSKETRHSWFYNTVFENKWFIEVRLNEESSFYKARLIKYNDQTNEHHSKQHFYYVLKQHMQTISLSGIPGIRAAYKRSKDRQIPDEKTGALIDQKTFFLETKGSNLRAVLQIPDVSYEDTYSNCAKEMEQVFGIDAAEYTIDDEAQLVLKSSTLNIHNRHTKLSAAVMCHSGQVLGFNRFGVFEEMESSLAAAAFEIPVPRLIEAAMKGALDPLSGPTEACIVGKEINIGSNTVKLIEQPKQEEPEPIQPSLSLSELKKRRILYVPKPASFFQKFDIKCKMMVSISSHSAAPVTFEPSSPLPEYEQSALASIPVPELCGRCGRFVKVGSLMCEKCM